jgi:hypothetical protein
MMIPFFEGRFCAFPFSANKESQRARNIHQPCVSNNFMTGMISCLESLKPMIAIGKFVSIETQINQSIRMDKIFKMPMRKRAKRMPTEFFRWREN